MNQTRWKIGVVLAIVAATLGWLAWTGIHKSASYYITIAQAKNPRRIASHRRYRVAGIVVPGSIQRFPGYMSFSLKQGNLTLPVRYIGQSPPPDTFTGNAQALAMGRFQPNGTLEATMIQAKCASKYAPKLPGQKSTPGTM